MSFLGGGVMIKWKTCNHCDGKYLPSKTSHEHYCGNCIGMKAEHKLKPVDPAGKT